VIDIPTDGGEQAQAFNDWTAAVVENNNWGPLFRRTRRDAAVNPCKRAPLPPAGGFDLSPPPENTGTLSKFLCHQSRRRGPSPYHVLYIVKENKTFDSYFGDLPTRGLPDADGDQTFLLFGEDGGTKNQHNLARTFTLGDNFWADSEASTTGHRWTSAGYANEYMEITWNPEYSEGFRGNRGGGQYENGDFICSNPGGCFEECGCLHDDAVGGQEGEQGEPEERLVDLLSEPLTNPRGITFRIYSDDVNSDSPALVQRVPLDLWGFRTSFLQHGRDLDFPDTDRANMFIFGTTVSHAWSSDKNNGQQPESFGKEIGFCGAPDRLSEANYPDGGFCARTGASPDEYTKYSLAAWVAQYDACRAGGGSDEACQSAMPNFIYMALPVNHTLGFNPGSPTPQSMVADNDYAVGLVMQELSKTVFWKNTLVLITEDDTQLTGDHVDAHRTYLMSAGGLSRSHGAEGRASHQAGSFPSILKTIQVLFGVPSLTIYDRAAVPLHDFIVVNEADRLSTPGYTAVDPGIPFASNPSEGALARLSQKVDWRIDRGDPALVTAIMYHGLRGWPLPEKYQALARE
jgi:hypothetical protein